MEHIYPYDVLQSHYVEFVYENDILMRNWAEFTYTKLANKKKILINLSNFLQIFLLVAETSSQTKKDVYLS